MSELVDQLRILKTSLLYSGVCPNEFPDSSLGKLSNLQSARKQRMHVLSGRMKQEKIVLSKNVLDNMTTTWM